MEDQPLSVINIITAALVCVVVLSATALFIMSAVSRRLRGGGGATTPSPTPLTRSGLGAEAALRRDTSKLASRYDRHGDPFCLVLIEVARAGGPRGTLAEDLSDYAAEVFLTAARTEDTVCRLDNHTFGVLLATTDAGGALRFADRARGKLSSAPAYTASGMTYLIMVAGVVEWVSSFDGFDAALAAARDQLDFEKQSIASQGASSSKQPRYGVPSRPTTGARQTWRDLRG